jgi:hypothetical protein
MQTAIRALTEELAEEIMEEEGLAHPDIERLVRYVWLVQSYPLASNGEEYYRENLAEWIRDEEEHYFGEHESTAEFARYYYENFETEWRSPEWVVVDWGATWETSLRHDFTAEDNGRTLWVWSDIY